MIPINGIVIPSRAILEAFNVELACPAFGEDGKVRLQIDFENRLVRITAEGSQVDWKSLAVEVENEDHGFTLAGNENYQTVEIPFGKFCKETSGSSHFCIREGYSRWVNKSLRP